MRARRSTSEECLKLKARLAEAEELLAAIRSGAVDALVTDGGKVFTLQSADRPYRILVETINEGAATLGPDGAVLYANRRLARMLGRPAGKIVGRPAADFFEPGDRPRLSSFLRRSGRGPMRAEFRLRGTHTPVLVSCTSLKSKGGTLCMALADLTAEKNAARVLQDHHDLLKKQVEERTAQLAESERKFRIAFESAEDAIIWADARNGRIVECNPEAERFFGRPRRELLGSLHTILHPAKARRQARAVFRTHARRGMPAVEFPVLTKSGRIRTASISASQLDLGAQKMLQAVFRDVTEQKRTEKALAESEERLRLALDSANLAPWESDLVTGRLVPSPRMASIYGVNRRRLPKTRAEWRNFIIGEDRPSVDAALEAAARCGGSYRVEYRIRRSDGAMRWVRAEGRLYRDTRGRPRRLAGLITDITDRKRTEEALKETGDYLGSLFDYANAPIIVWDPDFTITRFNRAFEEMTGYAAEEVLGKSLRILFPAESKTRSLNEIRRTAAGEHWESIEIPIRRKDGETRMALWNSANIYGKDGTSIVSTIAQGQDITVRTRAEEELRRLNRTLTALSESNKAMMRAKSEKAYLREICRIIVRDCGHAMAWVGFAGQDAAKTVLPIAQAGHGKGYLAAAKINWADTARGRGPTGRAIRTGRPCFCRDMRTAPEFRLWRREALRRGYASSVALPLKTGGEVFGVITIYARLPDPFSPAEVRLLSELADDCAYGITALRLREEHAKAEEALAVSRKLLDSIINNTPHYVYALDLEGRFIIANTALAHGYGQVREKLIGKKRSEIMPAGTAAAHEANDRKVVAAGRALEFEERAVVHGDAVTFLTIKSPLRDAHGKVYAVAGISTDISVRKKAEEILRRDKKSFGKLIEERTAQLVEAQMELERAKRLSDIGTLAATVAHELRNPLAAINLAAGNIRRKVGAPEIASNLATIDKKIAESDQIISNLLFYSRLRPPRREEFALLDVLEDSLASVEANRFKGRAFVQRLDPLKGVSVRADPLQIQEVFNNILNNACDAVSPEDGAITVTGKAGFGDVTITVRDNGGGIPPRILERIFNPFFSTKAKGTGLGLSVCRQIVVVHGGSIRVASAVGKGTTVTVRLPASAGRETDSRD